MTHATRSTRHVGDKCLALIREFPLRPLRSEKDLDHAIEVLDTLSDRRRAGETVPEEHDDFLVLARLVRDYEEKHHPILPVSGVEAPLHLIESKGVTQAQVAAETGLPESALS